LNVYLETIKRDPVEENISPSTNVNNNAAEEFIKTIIKVWEAQKTKP
jgi:hypothetical protein